MTMTDDTNVDVCGGLEATAEQLDDLLHLLLRGEGDWMMADTKVPRHPLREQRHLRTWVVSPGYPLACVKLQGVQLQLPFSKNQYLSSKMLFEASKYGKMTVTLGHFDL